MSSFNVTILTLYPEIFPGPLNYSILKRAKEKGLWQLKIINIRDFANNKYKKVDDELYGGGRGLLLKPDVISRATEYAFSTGASKNLVVLTPGGKSLSQGVIKTLAKLDGITIICGHFEGIDYRIIEKYSPLEISMGDFIVSGGEIPAMAVVDACIRLLPEAVSGGAASVENESFEQGLLEHPQYTRPFDFEGRMVPEVLTSGNHKEIAKWKHKASLKITKEKRPDLWQKYKQGVQK